MRGLFVTGVGTGVGKTFVTRGLTAALVATGRKVAALKPLETGFVDPAQSDAAGLARAAGRPELHADAGFYRATAPLSPYAATLNGEPPPPPLRALVDAVHRGARGCELCLVESAGGLLVPIDARSTTAELAAALGIPLLLVAPNALGVLSAVLTSAECARQRSIEVRAVVLVDAAPGQADLSAQTNARILDERLGVPVFEFPWVEQGTDAELASAALSSGLLSMALESRG
jgi:dethiobiotin synthetase